MTGLTNTPRFQPDPEMIDRAVAEAIDLLGVASISAAVLRLQKQLSEGPPATVPVDAVDQWRSNQQRTLSELRSQIMHINGDEGANLTAISEAFGVVTCSMESVVAHAREAAITQAWIVAAVEQGRIDEAINPQSSGPAPGPTRIQRARVKVGNAAWEAGDHLGAWAERCGLLLGKALRFPLQRIGGLIAGEVEL